MVQLRERDEIISILRPDLYSQYHGTILFQRIILEWPDKQGYGTTRDVRRCIIMARLATSLTPLVTVPFIHFNVQRTAVVVAIVDRLVVCHATTTHMLIGINIASALANA